MPALVSVAGVGQKLELSPPRVLGSLALLPKKCSKRLVCIIYLREVARRISLLDIWRTKLSQSASMSALGFFASNCFYYRFSIRAPVLQYNSLFGWSVSQTFLNIISVMCTTISLLRNSFLYKSTNSLMRSSDRPFQGLTDLDCRFLMKLSHIGPKVTFSPRSLAS